MGVVLNIIQVKSNQLPTWGVGGGGIQNQGRTRFLKPKIIQDKRVKNERIQ